MPPPSRRFRVSHKDLEAGTKIEAEEHPGFSERSHRRIARQHIEKYGPGYYRTHQLQEKVVERENERLHARPQKRRRPAPPGPFFDPNMRRFGL